MKGFEKGFPGHTTENKQPDNFQARLKRAFPPTDRPQGFAELSIVLGKIDGTPNHKQDPFRVGKSITLLRRLIKNQPDADTDLLKSIKNQLENKKKQIENN